MRVEVLSEHPQLDPWQTVTVKLMGNITEVRYCMKNRRGCAVKKINKDNYVVMSTGELKGFVHHEKRLDDVSSIKQSIKRLRELINTNVTDPKKCKWLTLTYIENMQILYNFMRILSGSIPVCGTGSKPMASRHILISPWLNRNNGGRGIYTFFCCSHRLLRTYIIM